MVVKVIPELGFVFVGDFFYGFDFHGMKINYHEKPAKSKELVVGVAQEELNRRPSRK